VVPLNANAGGEGGELLGATSHPAQREADPIATRVLSRGEAVAAPPGRADDFSWPRADANAGDADIPAPGAAGAAAPAKGAKTDSSKNEPTTPAKADAAKKPNDVKNPQAPAAAVPAPAAPPKPRRTGEQLDGAPPRPPLPVGPAAATNRGGF
jgi:hypothetical protein